MFVPIVYSIKFAFLTTKGKMDYSTIALAFGNKIKNNPNPLK